MERGGQNDPRFALRDAERVAVLYGLLLPYRGMVVGLIESSAGAVDRYLGLAARTAGDLGTAGATARRPGAQRANGGPAHLAGITAADKPVQPN